MAKGQTLVYMVVFVLAVVNTKSIVEWFSLLKTKDYGNASLTPFISDDHAETKESPQDQTCVFVLASPGSGSSTMLNLLETCFNNCTISGENWGAFKALREFHESIMKTEKQGRNSDHSKAAWKKVFDISDIKMHENNLVHSILNPNNGKCWGFKEIRYGRDTNNLAKSIEYLTSLCTNPKIILHTRRSYEDEFGSSVLKNKNGQQKVSIKQHECFDSYVGKYEKTVDPVCVPETSASLDHVFRHYLEDYIEQTENFTKLWKDFLQCDNNVPAKEIRTVSRPLTKKSENATVTGPIKSISSKNNATQMSHNSKALTKEGENVTITAPIKSMSSTNNTT